MDDPRIEAGMAVRREVLGEAHVARAEAAVTDFDKPFRDFIAAGAWGSVWTREGLDRRERSLLTLAILAALGHWEEFAMHVRATRNTGATPEDLAEALMHVAVYAGVPAANRAFAVAKRELGVAPDAAGGVAPDAPGGGAGEAEGATGARPGGPEGQP